MVASQAELIETPETIVLEMSEHMQVLAANADWAEAERIAVRLRSAIMNVSETKRRSLLAVAQRSTDKVSAEAEKARQDVSGRISAIRRGQAATKAYRLR